MQTYMKSDTLAAVLEKFLAENPDAVVLEDGVPLFEFVTARYCVSGDETCVLHIWSEKSNIVRRVSRIDVNARSLSLTVLRFGDAEPRMLEINADRNHRPTIAKQAARFRYQKLLRGVLERDFEGWRIEHLSTRADLVHGWSPAYSRAVLRRGRSALAILGVNEQENETQIDMALTCGTLWMHYQRKRLASIACVEGLNLFVPPGRSEALRRQMAHLDADAAKWKIYELNQRTLISEPVGFAVRDNQTRGLTRAVNEETTIERLAPSIARIQAIVPKAEVTVQSACEVAFRFHGFKFACAHIANCPGSFHTAQTITFELGGAQYVLDESTELSFHELLNRIIKQRQPGGSAMDTFYRLCRGDWLGSLIRQDIRVINPHLDGRFLYSVYPVSRENRRAGPAILTCTLAGRLAVIELRASEDMQFVLNGLEHWGHVRQYQQCQEFQANGYFPGIELSTAPPLLYFVSPALSTHRATHVLLRYLRPDIEWELVKISEQWRSGVRALDRKRDRAVLGEVTNEFEIPTRVEDAAAVNPN